MKVQLLYFPGCPNAEATRETLRGVLAKHRLAVPLEEICTTAPDTPAHLRGWGSPTILIDGMDVGGDPSPGGASCRLYRNHAGRLQGIPPASLVEAGLSRTQRARNDWFRSLAAAPGAVLALLPSVTCPACAAAYAGVFSSLGLGFLLSEPVLAPIILAFLVVGVASVGWSMRSHRHPGPLVATLLGAAGVVVGRLLWHVPAVFYPGLALLIAASIWNLWLKRPRQPPLIQLRLERSE